MKKWYKSRTVWSAILKIVAGLTTSTAGLLVGEVEIQTFMVGIATAIWGLYDIKVRFETNQAITK